MLTMVIKLKGFVHNEKRSAPRKLTNATTLPAEGLLEKCATQLPLGLRLIYK